MSETARIDKDRAEKARAALERIGISQARLARALKVHPGIVYEVLRGRLIGVRGDTHKVAVALGLKDGETMQTNMTDAQVIEALRESVRREKANAV